MWSSAHVSPTAVVVALCGVATVVASFLPWTVRSGDRNYSGWDLYREFGAFWTLENEGWVDATGDVPTGAWTIASGLLLMVFAGQLTWNRAWGARVPHTLATFTLMFALWAGSMPVVMFSVFAGPEPVRAGAWLAVAAAWTALVALAVAIRSWWWPFAAVLASLEAAIGIVVVVRVLGS